MNSNTYNEIPSELLKLFAPHVITIDESIADHMVEMREAGKTIETIPVEQFIARKRAERKRR